MCIDPVDLDAAVSQRTNAIVVSKGDIKLHISHSVICSFSVYRVTSSVFGSAGSRWGRSCVNEIRGEDVLVGEVSLRETLLKELPCIGSIALKLVEIAYDHQPSGNMRLFLSSSGICQDTKLMAGRTALSVLPPRKSDRKLGD